MWFSKSLLCQTRKRIVYVIDFRTSWLLWKEQWRKLERKFITPELYKLQPEVPIFFSRTRSPKINLRHWRRRHFALTRSKNRIIHALKMVAVYFSFSAHVLQVTEFFVPLQVHLPQIWWCKACSWSRCHPGTLLVNEFRMLLGRRLHTHRSKRFVFGQENHLIRAFGRLCLACACNLAARVATAFCGGGKGGASVNVDIFVPYLEQPKLRDSGLWWKEVQNSPRTMADNATDHKNWYISSFPQRNLCDFCIQVSDCRIILCSCSLAKVPLYSCTVNLCFSKPDQPHTELNGLRLSQH